MNFQILICFSPNALRFDPSLMQFFYNYSRFSITQQAHLNYDLKSFVDKKNSFIMYKILQKFDGSL